jgi:hypothetical protein
MPPLNGSYQRMTGIVPMATGTLYMGEKSHVVGADGRRTRARAVLRTRRTKLFSPNLSI